MTDAPLHEEALLLSPYLDHVLEPAEAARLEAHLASCDACRRQLDGLRQTVALVRALPPERMPRPVSIPLRRQRWEWRSAVRPLAGAAAALVLVVGAYNVGRSGLPNLGGARGAAAPATDQARGAAPARLGLPSGQGQAQDTSKATDLSRFGPAQTPANLTLRTEKPSYSSQSTLVVFTQSTGGAGPLVVQLDQAGYRVRIANVSGGPGEVRTDVPLASLPLAPGQYLVVATLPLDGPGGPELVAQVPITIVAP